MPTNPDTNASRSERLRGTYTGAITDVLYGLGRGGQTLPHTIRPLVPGQRIAAPVFTIEWAPYLVHGADAAHDDRAWEVFSAVPPGHAAVGATHMDDCAVIGDLAIAHLRARGCEGVIVDGGCRDIDLSVSIGLPTFCAFTTPQDVSHGRGDVKAWGHEIAIGEVRVRTGDFVVADADGVVVVPLEIVDEVLERTEDLVRSEVDIRAALLAGESPLTLFAKPAGTRRKEPQ